MTPLERNRLLSVLNTNGFHAEIPAIEDWVAAEATFAQGCCYVTARRHEEEYLVGTTQPAVAKALVAEGYRLETGHAAPPEIALGIFPSMGDEAFRRLVRRVFQLSLALPTVPLDQFVAKTRHLPATTEAERWAVQRIGQDIYRNALLGYWRGCCAVTGIDQPELLRASHCKPWAEATDAERLDVYNGLLLVADVDAAFDCGLIAFDDEGVALLSDRLSRCARRRFQGLQVRNARLLTDAHRDYLAWHRTRRFQQKP